jgi:hypothetical protein
MLMCTDSCYMRGTFPCEFISFILKSMKCCIGLISYVKFGSFHICTVLIRCLNIVLLWSFLTLMPIFMCPNVLQLTEH